MEQHCEVQQQLLQHVFVEKHFGEAGGDDEFQGHITDDTVSENGFVLSFDLLHESSEKVRHSSGYQCRYLNVPSLMKSE